LQISSAVFLFSPVAELHQQLAEHVQLPQHENGIIKRWKPYTGPAAWNFIVLDAPQKSLEGEGDELREVSNR